MYIAICGYTSAWRHTQWRTRKYLSGFSYNFSTQISLKVGLCKLISEDVLYYVIKHSCQLSHPISIVCKNVIFFLCCTSWYHHYQRLHNNISHVYLMCVCVCVKYSMIILNGDYPNWGRIINVIWPICETFSYHKPSLLDCLGVCVVFRTLAASGHFPCLPYFVWVHITFPYSFRSRFLTDLFLVCSNTPFGLSCIYTLLFVFHQSYSLPWHLVVSNKPKVWHALGIAFLFVMVYLSSITSFWFSGSNRFYFILWASRMVSLQFIHQSLR